MKYTFYSYPDHSWLKVPTKQIVDLGIAEEISEWSFYSPNGNHTYLEEDVDAGKFIKAMGGINSTCKHVEHQTGCNGYQKLSVILLRICAYSLCVNVNFSSTIER